MKKATHHASMVNPVQLDIDAVVRLLTWALRVSGGHLGGCMRTTVSEPHHLVCQPEPLAEDSGQSW